jgi:hypothetical protein
MEDLRRTLEQTGVSRLRRFPSTIVFVAACCLTVGGCGKSKPIMEGLVTLDGVPIEKGLIMLMPANGKGQTAGGGIEAGRYRISASPGPMAVRINAARKDGKMLDPAAPWTGAMVDRYVEYVPDRYNENTLLEVTIKPGLNKHDFSLEGGTVGKPRE